MDDILQYAPATIELATTAALLAALVGVPLGVLAAIRRNSWIDHLARFVSLLGVSAPRPEVRAQAWTVIPRALWI